jgi:TetR/AcrR family transcriptional regulator, transcriptional repressor for nem operon
VRYASDHKAETRKRVLKEAGRAIRLKGPGGVAVSSVMERAGLTHGGFYAHFTSKDELVAEAIGTMFDDARARTATLTEGDDPRRMLRAYLDFYLSAAHRDGRDRGCPLPALSGDLARADTTARARFGVGVAGLAARLAVGLRGIGCATPEADATAMLAQMVGAVALARAVPDGAQSDAILADTHANLVARYRLGDVQ